MMDSFEHIMDTWLRKQNYSFRTFTKSYTKLDFTVHLNTGAWFKLEVKEKRQPLKRANWEIPADLASEDVFILDDLTARKILKVAPFSGVAVQDRVRSKYFVADVLELWMMPRVRINRKITKDKLKGKWILDFNNFIEVSLDEIIPYFEQITEPDTHYARYVKQADCYGSFVGEDIGFGGELRTKAHRKFDHMVTR